MHQRSKPAPAPLPREWLVLAVSAPPRGEEYLLVDALRRLGARAVEREGERFFAYLAPGIDLEDLLRNAEAAVRASTTLRDPTITWGWRDHEEWVERWSHPREPRRVSDRIVIASTQPLPPAAEGEVLIRLHPGVAFGTAEHPTTRGCLRTLDTLVKPGSRIADVGAGTAILSIAAALLGAREVLAFEIDSLSCATAERNVALNQVGDRVEVRPGEVLAGDLERMERFDGITANLELAIVLPLMRSLREALAPDGWLIVSGILRQERETLVRTAGEVGLQMGGERPEHGWWTGWFRAGAERP
jgi:ribosomal protein L11 methyltransferase